MGESYNLQPLKSKYIKNQIRNFKNNAWKVLVDSQVTQKTTVQFQGRLVTCCVCFLVLAPCYSPPQCSPSQSTSSLSSPSACVSTVLIRHVMLTTSCDPSDVPAKKTTPVNDCVALQSKSTHGRFSAWKHGPKDTIKGLKGHNIVKHMKGNNNKVEQVTFYRT